MPINLQGSGNIAEGWPGPPQLHAPEIGSLVGAILRNRLGQQELTQNSIAAAIKEFQQQRESSAYIEAAQKAGLLPAGDYGGLGVKSGASIAKMIQDQQEAESLAKYRGILGDVAQRRTQLSEDWASTAADEPETYTDPQGVTWRRTKSGWTPMPTGLQSTDVRGQSEQQQLQEENKLLQRKGDLEALSETEKQLNIKALKPNVPFSRADEYNRMVQRLKEIQSGHGQPQAGGGGGGGQSSPYATPDQIKMARARQALDDPQATDAEKEQARKILAGE